MITSKSQLSDYCLRKLGAPVINIELDDDQISDRIDDALQKFILRHYDGADEFVERIVLKHSDIEKGFVKMPENIMAVTGLLGTHDKTNVEFLDDLDYRIYLEINQNPVAYGTMSNFYIKKEWLKTVAEQFIIKHNFEFNSSSNLLYHHEQPAAVSSIKAFTEFTLTNCTYTLDDTTYLNDKIVANTITLSDTTFSMVDTYETTWYPKGLWTLLVRSKQGTFTGQVDIAVTDRDGNTIYTDYFTPTSLWDNYIFEFEIEDSGNDLNVTLSGTGVNGETIEITDPILYKNNFLVVKGYKAVDLDYGDNVWNNEWLREYATSLMKKQWGQNISKYEGVQLPGGITMNGLAIYEQALTELEILEQRLKDEYEEPIDFFIG